MTNRLNVLLLLVLLASALYLIHLSHDGRRLFTALDRAQTEARQLEFDHQRLLAERQAQATPLRVEKTAREKLAMRSATPAVTHYIDAPDVAGGSLRTAAAAVETPPAAATKGRP
jgi:cell division protein FtsL